MTVAESERLLGSLIIARDQMNAATTRLTAPEGDTLHTRAQAKLATRLYQNIYIRVISAMTGVPVADNPW